MKPSYTPTLDPKADYHTVHGAPVYLLDPDRTPILSADIYEHGRGAMRYNGAPRVSVLAHSALVALLAERTGENIFCVRDCAAHDLHEVYVGEVVTGMKPYLRGFKDLESVWEQRMRLAVGIGIPLSPHDKAKVKHYDLRALVVEMTWYKHPHLKLLNLPPATPSEMRAAWMTLPRVPGMDWLNWRRLCRWLPRLRWAGRL